MNSVHRFDLYAYVRICYNWHYYFFTCKFLSLNLKNNKTVSKENMLKPSYFINKWIHALKTSTNVTSERNNSVYWANGDIYWKEGLLFPVDFLKLSHHNEWRCSYFESNSLVPIFLEGQSLPKLRNKGKRR